jgi:ubiquinone/menaquinone biosynthesis C-methylase UbiE
MAANIWHQGKLNSEDHLFRIAIPHSNELERHVSEAVKRLWPKRRLEVIELGCGTGFSTAAILRRRSNIALTALDNDPCSLAQARRNLRPRAGSIKFVRADLLSYLSRRPTASVDAIVGKFTLHNLNRSRRTGVLRHIHRVLKTGGLFANADKYALEGRAHAAEVRKQMIAYLDLFLPLGRRDLLQEALEHTLVDEDESRIMRERQAVRDMRRLGFRTIKRVFRRGMDAVYLATK